MTEQPPAASESAEKRILRSDFPGDDGTASADVSAALAEFAAGGDYEKALGPLFSARLLVPVVAVLGEVEYDERGLAHDKTSDMATVLLTGADGRKALLAFTGTDALQRWRADARPVPVWTRDAARSAIQEGADALVIDVAGPVPFAIEGNILRLAAV
ncbi:hypothetical protein Back2_26430 [Nocardioides baekrokdamisoli]|uniref:SseB protein N-terminal domain-containing protein n=1 Tax=Nocardioides baekrokdamisoli TaxID=1804624 RepID=A0A3G9IJ90_9ACTN|nr:SseB family protein [Nocardioides baekrokdamisoli]BBH18356.1 hypothetical protein Back2_26430 [Nocardioides baekrokdamisoli]